MQGIPNFNDPKDSVNFLFSLDPRHFKNTILNKDWLKAQPKERLIRAILVLATRLQGDPTLEVKKSELPFDLRSSSSATESEDGPGNYLTVPDSMRDFSGKPNQQWIMVLEPKDGRFQQVQINILDNFTIGRMRSGKVADLDLSPFEATKLGVSGQHAAIRVTPKGLDLFDLESTNGTYYNWEQMDTKVPARLNEGDHISFAKLVFRISKIEKVI